MNDSDVPDFDAMTDVEYATVMLADVPTSGLDARVIAITQVALAMFIEASGVR
jgi:hypothetical protein